MLWEELLCKNLASTDAQGVGTWSGTFRCLKCLKCFLQLHLKHFQVSWMFCHKRDARRMWHQNRTGLNPHAEGSQPAETIPASENSIKSRQTLTGVKPNNLNLAYFSFKAPKTLLGYNHEIQIFH